MGRARDGLVVGASRVVAIGGLVALVGALPWLSGRSPEYTILRARYADLEATPEALASVRAQLGLDRGPLAVSLDWLAGVVRGDLGTSWISGRPVLPGTLDALGVSLTLMAFAVAVAVVVAALLCATALRDATRGRRARGSGALAAALTALPEFVLATALLVVVAVWLRWAPPSGWDGPANAALPAVALGIPAGGLVGRLLADAIRAASAERWVATWAMAGISPARTTLAVLRRALPSVLGQVGLVLVGLTGGAVAVEQVFAIPGIGRATLGAAGSQDVPALQAGVLALLAVAVAAGALADLLRRALLGPALRLGSLPVPDARIPARPRDAVVPAVAAGLLALIVVAGLARDPLATTAGRLAPPSWALPFGADASGRDLLGRVGHGAVTTLGTALLVVVVCCAIGLALGLLPRAAIGPIEVANAAPPILVGIVVAAIQGPSTAGAALAVAAVGWAPLAAHAGALMHEARAQPHVRILPVLGVGRARILLAHLLPAVVGPVVRNAMLRLPGVALTLAALGFLGLGSARPTPEWGLILSEGGAYAERAPWAVGAPALALVLAAVLAVSLSAHDLTGLVRRRTPAATPTGTPAADAVREPVTAARDGAPRPTR
ncbi:peptide/nickel transport system permease protein [Clavibacter michiganensis]|uniref:ABC transporter permease subunit n=1 Tax=Clavibacter michiganensis TaxID=28447 RepID=UPI001DB98AB6|nr:ABC transporter permease subunit [Clavibacter michiganensis]MBP2457638.1 peptide/nickel transport system permease protein [Clavibacter michiganensis]MDQ0410208.1 peptide/nickel transport system permease protein [Clavibacter michiganensis]